MRRKSAAARVLKKLAPLTAAVPVLLVLGGIASAAEGPAPLGLAIPGVPAPPALTQPSFIPPPPPLPGDALNGLRPDPFTTPPSTLSPANRAPGNTAPAAGTEFPFGATELGTGGLSPLPLDATGTAMPDIAGSTSSPGAGSVLA